MAEMTNTFIRANDSVADYNELEGDGQQKKAIIRHLLHPNLFNFEYDFKNCQEFAPPPPRRSSRFTIGMTRSNTQYTVKVNTNKSPRYFTKKTNIVAQLSENIQIPNLNFTFLTTILQPT